MQIGLVVAGAVAGAVFGLVLTRLGKLATGAPPAPLANYVWNAAVFGALAAVVSPVITWSALRRVPLWRTVAEPLGAAVAGGCGAVILGVPVLLLVLPPLGFGLGFANLRRRYPDAFEGNTLAASLRAGAQIGITLLAAVGRAMVGARCARTVSDSPAAEARR